MKAKLQICTVTNYLYSHLLKFEADNGLTNEQQELIDILKELIEESVGYSKYSTQMLADYNGDPAYLEYFFDPSKDYVEEIKELSKKIEIDDFEQIEFVKPDDKWSKYALVDLWEKSYKISLLINKTLSPKFRKKFALVIRRIERAYFLAYRICRKLQEYEDEQGIVPSAGKHEKLKSIDFYTRRFKKLSNKRYDRWIKESKNPLDPLWKRDG